MKLSQDDARSVRDRVTEYLRSHRYLLPDGVGSQKSKGVRWIVDRISSWDFKPDGVFRHAEGDAKHVVRRATLPRYTARWENKNFHPPKLRWGWAVSNNAARKVDLDPRTASVFSIEEFDPFWAGVFLVGELVAGWNEHGYEREAYNQRCVQRLESIALSEIRRHGG